jgi:hypothetical protein
MVCDDKLFAPMEGTYEVVDHTERLRDRVLSKSRGSVLEGVKGCAESWTTQTPVGAAGSWANQIEQSTRCNHVENRQNGRLCAAVETPSPPASAGDCSLSLKWWLLGS